MSNQREANPVTQPEKRSVIERGLVHEPEEASADGDFVTFETEDANRVSVHDDQDDRAGNEIGTSIEMLALSELRGKTIVEVRNNEAALIRKLADVALFTSIDGAHPRLPFSESLCITLPMKRPMSDKLAVDDLERERQIATVTTEAVHCGLDRLRKDRVKFRRPNDYFAEMVKSDEQMGKIKKRILCQKERIESVQTRINNRDLKKNRKKVRQDQIEKEQEKKQKANQQIAAVSRLRQSRLLQRETGVKNGSDTEDDEFPIDMVEVEQLDSDSKFQRFETIASGKKKPWTGHSDARDGGRSKEDNKKRIEKPNLRLGKGIKKKGKLGKKKRLGKSRRVALKNK